ncbi:hypothetical protein TIFTF001_025725 [Ficus carica]|uniref:Uncharacterized protein n=1 Tax=Ficus carica TaxID=3494 RepID=A0AA88APH7_FICCA|nr:hypothetical protein TIFTF001_025725 [Ficus carica]
MASRRSLSISCAAESLTFHMFSEGDVICREDMRLLGDVFMSRRLRVIQELLVQFVCSYYFFFFFFSFGGALHGGVLR